VKYDPCWSISNQIGRKSRENQQKINRKSIENVSESLCPHPAMGTEIDGFRIKPDAIFASISFGFCLTYP